MGLLTPLFLVALAGLAVPVIIHMIQREKKNVVEFPSLMFLRRIPYQSVRRRHIRNWPLLLLRLAALALIVAAFARPFLRTASITAAASGGAKEVVILIDRSYSIGYGDRWARAVALARDRVSELGASDRASIVFFDSGAEVALRSASDKGRLTSAISAGKVSAAATKFGPALKLAGSILSESALTNREVLLISDFQRAGWLGAEGVRLPDGAAMIPASVATDQVSNVSVAPAVLLRSTFNDRERITVTSGAINRSTSPASVDLTLEVDGRAIQTRTLKLEAGGSGSASFDPFSPASRFTRGTVRAGDDRLARDNAYHFVVSPRDRVKVVIAGGARESSLYMARALALGETPSFDVVQQGADADPTGASVVILNDLAVSPAAAERLATFVENGGGLFLALGPRASWPGASDILPAQLGQPIDRTRGTAGRLGVLEYGHSIFESFRAPRSGDFSSARVYTYRAVTPHTDAQVLARFDDGAPALLERRTGRGKVILWTTALDVGWNDLALKPVFLPFIHRVAANLASYTERPSSMTVGDVLPASSPAFAEATAGKTDDAVVLSPAGERIPMADRSGGVVELREQGFYEVRSGERDPAPLTVASNVDLKESDMTPVDPQEVTAGATGKAGGSAASGANATYTNEERERTQRVWWYLLFAGMLLLAAETVLSNKLGKVRV
ncbi:MAG: BatA domain-containing protein [Acidobacteria bacterium]|nr:BatA domain-containing protein [Acidobacteriota bacterium]